MAIVELSVFPVGTDTPSISTYVASAVRVLESAKDIKYEVTGMGTIIEGDLERLLTLVGKMHQAVFDAGAMRVETVCKIDERRDKVSTVSGKLESLKKKLDK
ncbi:hypothetical protein ES703_15058 [subsurface metagenome]